jgi:hypothetical protein
MGYTQHTIFHHPILGILMQIDQFWSQSLRAFCTKKEALEGIIGRKRLSGYQLGIFYIIIQAIFQPPFFMMYMFGENVRFDQALQAPFFLFDHFDQIL